MSNVDSDMNYIVGICGDCFQAVRFVKLTLSESTRQSFEDILSFEDAQSPHVSYVYMPQEPDNLCECPLEYSDIHRGVI